MAHFFIQIETKFVTTKNIILEFYSNLHTANPCESTPCKNGGKCENKGNDFQCECSENYEGDTCESIGWYNIL